MAWNNADAIADFEDLQIAEFGEPVTFINGSTLAQSTISAVRPTYGQTSPALKQSTTGQNRAKIEILVSQGASGKSNIRPDIDKIKMKISPSDTLEKTLIVCYVKNEYGAWRVGLG